MAQTGEIVESTGGGGLSRPNKFKKKWNVHRLSSISDPSIVCMYLINKWIYLSDLSTISVKTTFIKILLKIFGELSHPKPTPTMRNNAYLKNVFQRNFREKNVFRARYTILWLMFYVKKSTPFNSALRSHAPLRHPLPRLSSTRGLDDNSHTSMRLFARH